MYIYVQYILYYVHKHQKGLAINLQYAYSCKASSPFCYNAGGFLAFVNGAMTQMWQISSSGVWYTGFGHSVLLNRLQICYLIFQLFYPLAMCLTYRNLRNPGRLSPNFWSDFTISDLFTCLTTDAFMSSVECRPDIIKTKSWSSTSRAMLGECLVRNISKK